MFGSEEFMKIVKAQIVQYFNNHADKTDQVYITDEDVYIVWYCKSLQNHKAMASTVVPDGMYYEVTYNGDKSELYLDAYKKWENVKVEL